MPFEPTKRPESDVVNPSMRLRMVATACGTVSSAPEPPISVFTQPGLMATQTIPSGLKAIAKFFQMLLSAALDAP